MSEDVVLEKESPTLDSRVDSLEQVNEKLLNTLQVTVKTLNEVKFSNEKLHVIMNSFLRTVQDGRPLTLDQLRESHHLVMSEKVNSVFNAAVKNGFLEVQDKIEENSIVLMQEFDSNGVELHRASELMMPSVDAEFKSLFLNKALGDRVPFVKDGQLQSTFVVMSIFKPSEKVEKQFSEQKSE